jgi:diacylglycerol O-acyltransferase / wax synthase
MEHDVKKLGAMDANFLYSETPSSPNHVASLQVFELPEHQSASQFIVGLKEFMAARIDLVPYLTRKLQMTPGGFDHPIWISDGDFSIENHIVEVSLSAPGLSATGNMEQLEAKVAELHAELMDRDIPLWKLMVITGLEDNNVAFYNQVHHACIDGMAGQAATQILMDTTPDHPVHTPPAGFPKSETAGLTDLYTLAWQNFFNTQIDATDNFLGSMDALARMGQRAIDPSKSFGSLANSAPRTRLNQSIGKERTFAVGELPLQNIKAIGKSLDCKVNDVFMAICSGGLRKYLQRTYELPNNPLISGCPVSLRKPGDTRMDNQVTMMSVSLATDIADPRLRLLTIRDSANTAKDVTADLASSLNNNFAAPGLPRVATATASLMESLGSADFISMPINVVISNVPGPRETLYSNGARMLTHYPVSIPAQGLGLNITVQSYGETLYFGLTACKKALPDAALLREDMISAYAELKSLLIDNKVTEIRGEVLPASPILDDIPMDRVA